MATILVLNGRNEGEWYTLGDRSMVFGRDDGLLAEILDPCVSRRHLEVRYSEMQRCYLAVDAGSRNGVIVNGDRIQGVQPLGDGDGILIGHTLLVFTDANFADDAAARECIDRERETFELLLDDLDRKDRAFRQRQMQATRVA